MNIISKNQIIVIYLPHNFEANHNKDYSVVKTLEAGAAMSSLYFSSKSKKINSLEL